MFLDEGQDINLVIVDIVYWQCIRMVIVGDFYQQFYWFRGVEDVLNSDWMVGVEEYYLIQSWWFGFVIVYVVNIIFFYKGEIWKF